MVDLEANISRVRSLRLSISILKDMIDERMSLWEEENRELLDSIEAERIRLREEEETLRAATLEAYRETGNKKPAPGVGIRIMKALDYEECQAIEWAVEAGAGNCLKLDKKNFEKAAEALALDFVTINSIPQATIAKEL
jgi:hypothetical protein